MADGPEQRKRRWRFYKTASGNQPVRAFLATLSANDAATVAAEMQVIMQQGLSFARHLRGDIYEVRADGATQSYRILFASEGRHHHILLALEGFSKKTQKTPPDRIALAEQRLSDWRERGRRRKQT
jgi:phage-related protein